MKPEPACLILKFGGAYECCVLSVSNHPRRRRDSDRGGKRNALAHAIIETLDLDVVPALHGGHQINAADAHVQAMQESDELSNSETR